MQQPAVYLMASAALVIVSTTFSLSLSQSESERDDIVDVGRKVGKKGEDITSWSWPLWSSQVVEEVLERSWVMLAFGFCCRESESLIFCILGLLYLLQIISRILNWVFAPYFAPLKRTPSSPPWKREVIFGIWHQHDWWWRWWWWWWSPRRRGPTLAVSLELVNVLAKDVAGPVFDEIIEMTSTSNLPVSNWCELVS